MRLPSFWFSGFSTATRLIDGINKQGRLSLSRPQRNIKKNNHDGAEVSSGDGHRSVSVRRV